jgi:predicted AlkP superfamily pyrophosphatase or phosphodiesterase
MLKRLITFICFLTAITAFAQTTARPKLVVGIVIDQMRYDYIYRYWDKYGANGFKRLVNEGFFCRNTNYNYVPTYTAPGHAAIYTGTTPSINGIIANDWFDVTTGKSIYCVTDNSVTSVGSSDDEGKRSPINLMTTTITDELRLATNMRSKVIGIALKDRSAVLPAGHLANAAYWYNGSNGCFISSSYYMKELPAWLKEFNKRQLPKKYLSESWKTILPLADYTESVTDDFPYEETFKGEQQPVFPHNIPALMAANGGLDFIRTTPFGNSLLKDFAMETITGENLGKSNATDFITISFSSTDYIGHAYGPNSVEVEDTYIRLDKDISELLDFINMQVGKNNALVFLTADHGACQIPHYLQDLRIPAGYANTVQLKDSVRNYLNRLYGAPLVLDFINQQIYLDRKTIELKKLALADVQNKVAEFVQKFPDVMDGISGAVLNQTQFTEGQKALMQRGFNTKRSGDVLVNYLPGYGPYHATGTSHGAPFSYDTHVPLFFYGGNIKPGSTSESVVIPDIAATLAMLLNIQFPSGCTGIPILSVVH